MIKKQYVGYFSILFSLIFPYIFEKAFIQPANFDVYLWLALPLLFISLHFFIEPKKIWDFVYRKRWFICAGILIFVLIMEYNTSSIGMYDAYIQPNYTSKSYYPIFGQSRAIRSDEWASTTPLKISQYRTSHKFSEINDIIMAKENVVTIYPCLPNLTISVLSMPRNWGYLIFDEARGLTVDSMFEWIFLIFVSFEFLMIITKKNKLYSLLGALILAFAPVILWWSWSHMILYGEAIVVMVNSFLKSNSKWKKLVKSVIIGWLIACDIMTMYPAWLIPFSYVFFVIVLYLLIKNTKKEEIVSTILYILLAFGIAIVLVLPSYISSSEVFELVNNTVYPGKRFSIGGKYWETLFNYLSALFLWYKPAGNNSESSQFIGLFPIPIIIGLIYTIKNTYYIYMEKKKKKKKEKLRNIDWLIVALTGLGLVYTINSFLPIPLLSKITLLSYSPTQRLSVVINYLCLIILFRYLATKEKKSVEKKETVVSFCISILCSIAIVWIFRFFNPDYATLKVIIVLGILFTIWFYCIILNCKKTNHFLLISMCLISVGTGIMVNPISRGVAVLHEKPLAKEVQKIVEKDRESVWISLNNSFVIGNYLATNGAKTINTTNMVPNFELWEKFDNFKQYDDVYNRYAYFMIKETEEDSYFYLNQPDLMTLHLNLKDLKILGVDYIVTSTSLKNPDKKTSLELLYSGDGQNIYKVNYK